MIEKWKEWCNEKLSYEGKARKIGLLVSGGADSAMALYVLSKHILDCDKDKRFSKSIIVPMHGWDQRRINVYSPDSAKDVIKVVKKLIPEAPIKNLQICGYYKEKGEEKAKYHNPFAYMLVKENIIDVYYSGSTKQPEEHVMKKLKMEDLKRTEALQRRKGPMGSYTKRELALLYKDYGLMEDLFPVTVSCIGDRPYPCKTCWWCLEKHDAFGMYDGGAK